MSKKNQTTKDEKFLNTLEQERATEVGAEYPLSPLERGKWQLDKAVQAKFDEASAMLIKRDRRGKPLTGDKTIPRDISALQELSKDVTDEDFYDFAEALNQSGTSHANIDLSIREHVLKKVNFPIGRTVLLFKTLSGKSHAVYVSERVADHLSLIILTGKIDSEPPKAYLNTFDSCEELSEFSLLSIIDETKENETGLFTYFNKKTETLYTGFFTAEPGFKNPKLTSRPSLSSKAVYFQRLDDNTREVIRNNFNDFALRYIARVKGSTGETSENTGIPTVDANPKTQEQMRNMCRLIQRRGQLGYADYFVINLNDLHQDAHKHDFGNGKHIEITMKPVGNREFNYTLKTGNGLNFLIIAGDTDKGKVAFAVFRQDDNRELIIELEAFSLLNVFTENKEIHDGWFTIFSKEHGILRTEFCSVFPKAEMSLANPTWL